MPSPIRQETPQTLTLKFRKHQKQPEEKNPDLKNAENTRSNPRRKTQKHRKLSSAAAVWKSTNHGRTSEFIYVTLDAPRERAGFVDLEAPRTSYGPR